VRSRRDLAGLYALAALASACASAGKDAPGGVDAAPRPDAPHTTGPDAAPAIDAPAGGLCASSATCPTALDLGSVGGDTGNTTVTATGYLAAWYHVRVTEDDSGVFGVPMAVTLQLTSPASEQYDLVVYVNTGSDAVECTTPSGSATTAGTTESTHLDWGESGAFSNGSDDSRTVSIEIRPKPGTCAAAQPWQLTATGDL
jgi:hypothetical protein